MSVDTVPLALKYLAVFLMFILAACQTTDEGVYRDKLGNVYPPPCRGDLSEAMKKTVIRYLPLDQMPVSYGTKEHMRGATSRGASVSVVMIAKDDPDQDDILRHELCHVVAGEWHAGATHSRY